MTKIVGTGIELELDGLNRVVIRSPHASLILTQREAQLLGAALQDYPHSRYTKVAALGTWRKMQGPEPGYVYWRGCFNRIESVQPSPTRGWGMVHVTFEAGEVLHLGPTTPVYERWADTP